MMQQYQEIKKSHSDALLFFRLGDFYEMFGSDAEIASKELEITLTGRGYEEKRIPMCGVPYHAVDSYIGRLISKGYRVVICEQTEDPALAKGLVKREVIRVITPGTVIDNGCLEAGKNNYLLALSFDELSYGLAYVDLSTGEFKSTDILSKDKNNYLYSEIARISPSECLIFIDDMDKDNDLMDFLKSRNILITKYKYRDAVDLDTAQEKIKKFFSINSIESFGLNDKSLSCCAASALIEYIKETQKCTASHIVSIKPYLISDFMFIDMITRRNLELVSNVRSNLTDGSLLSILDKTKTGMGSRLLRSWILQPLLDVKQIEKRLDAVEELTGSLLLRENLGASVSQIYDIERLTSRIASGRANAKDLIALKASLKSIPEVKKILKNSNSGLLREILSIPDFSDIIGLIESGICDDPPHTIKDGGLIKSGFDPDLDDITNSAKDAKKWILEFESNEKLRTGIKSLKVGFTKVFGYYIDITSSNLKYVPDNYIRKQTLVNCERFITPELKEKESHVINSDEKAKELEYQIFCSIREQISKTAENLQKAAFVVSRIDALISLAEAAVKNNYCRPQINDIDILEITDGRHPVVEQMNAGYRFVPNSAMLNNKNSFVIITGPNMGGKSTYMRQVALTTLMAQIGSFVPARSASVCIFDRIFTRIGAMDDLSSGQSTFMVEMTEVSNILNNATSKSLIILDEIGRGTSTFDGMSIACAVAEYIFDKIKAKTFFATHYHELTRLSDTHDGIFNFNAGVKEEGEHVTFLYRMLEGAADKSYGIHVAKYAGLPNDVINRAYEVYSSLSRENVI